MSASTARPDDDAVLARALTGPLREAHEAFLAGDHARSRGLARALAESGSDVERSAARTFLARFRPDPAAILLTVGSLLFFAISILVYARR